MLRRSTVGELQAICLELSTLYNPFVLNRVNVGRAELHTCTRALQFEGDPELHASRIFEIQGNGFFTFPAVLYIIFFPSPVKRKTE